MSTLKTNNIQHVDRSDPSIIINTDGSVSIAGTATYEDVTSIDSVGIITGREIINAQKQVHVGTGVSVKAGGLNVTAGITTVQALQATTGAFSDDVSIADKIVHTGDTNTAIRFPATDNISFETAGSERLRIKPSGLIGIGQATPTHMLHVDSSNASDSTATAFFKGRIIRFDGAASSDSPRLNFSLDGTDKAQILCHRTALGLDIATLVAEPIRFKINDDEKVQIDSNGRLLLGTTTEGHSNADDLTIATSANTGITIRSGTSNDGNIFFSDATSGDGETKGTIKYDHGDDKFTLNVNGSTRLSVNSSGNSQFTGIVTATEFVPTLTQLSHKNLIINGAMFVAQRSTTSTETNYATVDRFKIFRDDVDENPTQSRHTLSTSDTPYSFGFRDSYHLTNGNQTSVGADDTIVMQTRLEAQDIANSGWNYTSSSSYITLSFWVKASVTQTYYVLIRSIDGTAQMYDFPIALTANTWQKVTHSIPGNSNLTFDDNNGLGLLLEWTIFRGTNDTTSSHTSNAWAAYSGTDRVPDMTNTWYDTDNATFEITGVQLEVGSQATPFEHRSFADELQRCHRYFYKTNRWMGGARGSGASRSFHLDFGMRLTGNDVSSGTYTNDGTAGGDVVYVGSNATRQASDVTANSLGASTSSNTNHLSLSVAVGYSLGSGDNGIVTGLYIGGFSIDHEI